MSKSASSPLASTKESPVKKLFDRPPVAKEVASKTKKSAKKGSNTGEIGEGFVPEGIMDENRPLNVYGLAMLVIILLILWTGVLIVEQVQNYHAQYSSLQKLKREHRALEIEYQRLLIEQQTFSATPQIAKRAVAELNMYYPKLSDRMILQSNSPQSSLTQTPDKSSPLASPHPAAKTTAQLNPPTAKVPPVKNSANQNLSITNEATR